MPEIVQAFETPTLWTIIQPIVERMRKKVRLFITDIGDEYLIEVEDSVLVQEFIMNGLPIFLWMAAFQGRREMWAWSNASNGVSRGNGWDKSLRALLL